MVASLTYRLNVGCKARQTHPEVRVHLKDLANQLFRFEQYINHCY